MFSRFKAPEAYSITQDRSYTAASSQEQDVSLSIDAINTLHLQSRFHPVLDYSAEDLNKNYNELSPNFKSYLDDAYTKFSRGTRGSRKRTFLCDTRSSYFKGVSALLASSTSTTKRSNSADALPKVINTDAYVSHIKDGLVFVTNTNDKNFSMQCTVAIKSRKAGRIVLGSVIDFNDVYARVYAFEGNENISIFDKVVLLGGLDSGEFNNSFSKSLKVVAPFVIDTVSSLSSLDTLSVLDDAFITLDQQLGVTKNFRAFNTVKKKKNFQNYYATRFLNSKKQGNKKAGNTWVGSPYLGNVDLQESLCIRVSFNLLGSIITATGNVLYNLKKETELLKLSQLDGITVVTSEPSSFYTSSELLTLGDRVRNFFLNYANTSSYAELSKEVRDLATYNNLSKYFYKSFRNSEVPAPSVMNRKKVIDPITSGITLVDILFPVGKGQRQLIIGDRQTGKTTIALDTIINQSKRSVARGFFGFAPTISVYVSIGQRQSEVYSILKSLKSAQALENTVIVSSPANAPCSFQFLAAYTGTTVAEYFRDCGRSVVVVYDDLSKHAVAYRQMSLLLRRSPSRESYPSDIFFVHARLLERSSFLRSGGSLTALPVVETLSNDVSAFIPTNVISITDGQLFLESSLFIKGNKPAIGIGFSVSRIGASAQSSIFKALAPLVRSQLAKYRSLEALKSFSDDLDAYTIRSIQRGERIWDVMKQAPRAPHDLVCQSVFSYCAVSGLLDSLSFTQVNNFKKALRYDASSDFLNFEVYSTLGSSLRNKTIGTKIKVYTSALIACLKVNRVTLSSVLSTARSAKIKILNNTFKSHKSGFTTPSYY